jgi:hypothetical protein
MTDTSSTQAVQAAQGSDPSAASSPSAAGKPTASSSTKLSSVGDLQKQAPEVYKAMLEGIAINICNEMKDHQDRIKKMMQEGRQQAGQSG